MNTSQFHQWALGSEVALLWLCVMRFCQLSDTIHSDQPCFGVAVGSSPLFFACDFLVLIPIPVMRPGWLAQSLGLLCQLDAGTCVTQPNESGFQRRK